MKVLLINGSPKAKGSTYTALAEVAAELERQGCEAEIVHVGVRPIIGCTACGYCRRSGSLHCVFDEDKVNTVIDKAAKSDGFVFGSPVHYAGVSGAVKSFLDRCFYAGSANFMYKPAASVVCCRRGGATAALDQLSKYFGLNSMPVVSSTYWNMVHGNNPEEIAKDLEGMQVMRNLGRNMAWLLKSIEAGRKSGIALPERERKHRTNFIR